MFEETIPLTLSLDPSILMLDKSSANETKTPSKAFFKKTPLDKMVKVTIRLAEDVSSSWLLVKSNL